MSGLLDAEDIFIEKSLFTYNVCGAFLFLQTLIKGFINDYL